MSVKIYGKNPAIELINSGRRIFKAFLMEEPDFEILKLLKQKSVPVEILEKHKFKKEFQGNHQGIVLEVEDYKIYNLNEFLETLDLSKDPLVLILDGITDPHNLGAIIRTAEAGGVAGIIIPKNRSASVNSTVVKVSSGAIEHIKIVEVTNLRSTIDFLKTKGFWTVGTDLKATKSYKTIDVSSPLALVIGSEGKGISKLILETVDYNVKIEMAGKINSLNASVSAGILIFDILSKRQS